MVKLTWKQIEPFLKNPDPAARVVLVYGPDNGLVKERAKTIGLTVVKDYTDPFNVAVLSTDILSEDPAKLSDEAGAISMMGGGRLIRVENGADKMTTILKDYLENPNPDALVVIEADNLTPRSSLRKLCESAKNAAAMPCYVEEGRDLAKLVRETLQAEGLGIEPDAVNWLSANIAGDRAKARSEIEKLILYKGADKSTITMIDAQASCGTSGAQSLDDLVFAVGARNSRAALGAYDLLLQEGVAFMAILRALSNHMRRLHMTKSHMADGEPLETAVKKLQPPVFFKQDAAFKAQINSWSLPALGKVLERLSELEAQCKQTGSLPETYLSQAILGLSYKKAA